MSEEIKEEVMQEEVKETAQVENEIEGTTIHIPNKKEKKAMAAEAKKAKEEVVPPHYCLLYWHKKGVGTIPVGRDETGKNIRLKVLPGYNAFMSNQLPYIIRTCKSLIDNGLITFFGIKIKDDGSFVEQSNIYDLTQREMLEIVERTVNHDTLEILSDGDVVGVNKKDLAANRIAKLADVQGVVRDDKIDTSADNCMPRA